MLTFTYILFVTVGLVAMLFIVGELLSESMQVTLTWVEKEYQTYTLGIQFEYGKNQLPAVGGFKAKTYSYYSLNWFLFVGKVRLKVKIYD